MEEQIYLMVDIGLHSGIKWANKNIGAENPWDNGLYFSWGNVDGHAVDESGNVTDGYSFDRDTYSTTSGGQYRCSALDAEYDAATVNMGSDWRMPTSAETVELVNNTVHYYIGKDGSVAAGPFEHTPNYLDKGLDGSTLRSICFVKKGEAFDYNDRSNFIEFPFVGNCYSSLLDGDRLYGGVWSSSAYGGNAECACCLDFNVDGYLCGGSRYSRYYGQSVRGVTLNNKQ